jgi:hypothetical protein
VTWIKLLSLIAVVVALGAAQGVGDRTAPIAVDRSEAAPGDDLDGGDAPDSTLLAFPHNFPAASTPRLSGRSHPESRTTPATSDHPSRIFRPPISVRA